VSLCGVPLKHSPAAPSFCATNRKPTPTLTSTPPRRPPQVEGREEALRAALVAADGEGSGLLGDDALDAALSAAGLKFTRHQLIALRRRADRERRGGVGTEEVLRLMGVAAAE
jgi:hypothetical protein